MPTATYDPTKVIVAFAGGIITGYADGTFVTAERAEDSFKKHVGSGGEVARSKSADRSGTITVTLMATSPSNDVLSAAQIADDLFGSGLGPVSVTDLGGRTLCGASNAWIRKPPKVEFGKEISPREWVFDCDRLEMKAGGTT